MVMKETTSSYFKAFSTKECKDFSFFINNVEVKNVVILIDKMHDMGYTHFIMIDQEAFLSSKIATAITVTNDKFNQLLKEKIF